MLWSGPGLDASSVNDVSGGSRALYCCIIAVCLQCLFWTMAWSGSVVSCTAADDREKRHGQCSCTGMVLLHALGWCAEKRKLKFPLGKTNWINKEKQGGDCLSETPSVTSVLGSDNR